MPLIGIIYWAVVGWLIAKYQLDDKAKQAVHRALQGLMREHAQITIEVHQAAALEPLGWVYRADRADLAGLNYGMAAMIWEERAALELDQPTVVPPNG